MANAFKNSTSTSVGTGATTVYTCPASTETTLIGLTLCNVTASSDIEVDVTCAGAHVVKNYVIPAGSSVSALEGKVVLEPTETVVVTSDTASSVDVIVSYLEIT